MRILYFSPLVLNKIKEVCSSPTEQCSFLSILSNDNRDKNFSNDIFENRIQVYATRWRWPIWMLNDDVADVESTLWTPVFHLSVFLRVAQSCTKMIGDDLWHCGVLSFIRIIILIGIYSKIVFVNETVHERIRFRKMNAPANQSAFIVMIAYACASLYTFMIVVQLEWWMTQSLSKMCIREVNVTLKLISRACRLS